jgi:nucleoside-diphosphate-sugar epimerase
MIYGRPGDRNMARLLAFVRRSPVVPIPGGGRRLIQLVHVDDLAGFIATALEADAAVGRAYDVAGPEPLTLRQIVEAAAQAVGRQPRLVSLPLGPVIAAVRAYERLSTKPRLKVEQVLRLDEDKAFDISAAVSLGYAPRSFADGIEEEAALIR